MRKKKKIVKIIIFVILAIFTMTFTAFGIYVSDYYHAEEYEVKNNNIIEKEHYIIYGNVDSKKGFIFYPGAKVEAKAYEPILSKIGEEGICCVLVKMPFHLAVLKRDAAKEVIEDIPQIQEWYIGGHSLGGAMAAGFAAENKENITGLILLAAYPTEKLENMPVLSIYGSEDGVLNMEKYAVSIQLADNLTEIIIEGGNHAQFGNYGQQKGDQEAKIEKEEQWNETVKQILQFIKRDLY